MTISIIHSIEILIRKGGISGDNVIFGVIGLVEFDGDSFIISGSKSYSVVTAVNGVIIIGKFLEDGPCPAR